MLLKKPFTILCAALMLCASGRAALGRQDAGRDQSEDEVVRVDTQLVQTGVTVFDKEGRFVEGLKREDFELRVDGRPVPISFFDQIVAGSRRDRLVRAAGDEPASVKAAASGPSFRQRTIVFFLDDRHLSLDSVARSRKMLLDFIEKEMGQDDLVAVASASGQIGFLQQFTDNKEVLRAAVSRILHVPYAVSDYGRNQGAPLTEYMALTIERKNDPGVFEFYVQDCMAWAPRGVMRVDRASIRRHCEVEVENRARQILLQAGTVTAGTYYSLETLLRYAAKLPGSKLAFFVSDGFLADTGPRGPTAADRLGRITDEARRAGVVIYTIDARGLVSGVLDATGNVAFDPNGRLESANLREIAASQDALSALAADTGGRALRNQNAFDRFINDALVETSRYYLIAWRPEAGDGQNERLKKIEVSVKGRPELTVRSARALFGGGAPPAADERAPGEAQGTPKQERRPPEKKADADLRQALADAYERRALPLQLSLIYLDTPASGTVLTSSVQAPAELLSYGEQGKEPARLTIEGVVLNDQGKPAASFRTGLKVDPPAPGGGARNTSAVIYNHPSPLKPGIYQVRVAARDERSGTVGSVSQWVVIPDLSTRQLSLSSLIVGLKDVPDKGPEGGRIQWSVDRRFARGSRLRFMTFVYNAAPPADLAARVQVFRDGRALVSTPFRKVAAGPQTDAARVPFDAEIGLGELQAGSYTLQVTVEDRAAQKSVSQQTVFYVE